MGIVYTNALQVRPQATLPLSEFAIHPNDGYDLRLMRIVYTFDVFANCSADEFNKATAPSVPGTLFLKNECRQGTIEMSDAYWERIGRPKLVKLVCSDTRLLVLNLHSPAGS